MWVEILHYKSRSRVIRQDRKISNKEKWTHQGCVQCYPLAVHSSRYMRCFFRYNHGASFSFDFKQGQQHKEAWVRGMEPPPTNFPPFWSCNLSSVNFVTVSRLLAKHETNFEWVRVGYTEEKIWIWKSHFEAATFRLLISFLSQGF